MHFLFYEFFLWIAALAYLPKGLYQFIRHGKYRHSLSRRLGLKSPNVIRSKRPVIWLHACSVGETKAISTLGKRIKQQISNAQIIVSSITETGHAEAKRSLPFAEAIFLPLDFRSIISPLVRKIKPDLLLISETDFWFNFMHSCKAQGTKIVLVNGKISQRSKERFQRFSVLSRALFSQIDSFCVQNESYSKRYEQIGIARNKLYVTGNMKFDVENSHLETDLLEKFRVELGIEKNQPVLVVGSTHDPEEKWILEQLPALWKACPQLKVLLVPRHPERFHEVAQTIGKKDIPFLRMSELSHKTGKERLILIDAMGLLRQCYQLANVAVVGGSFFSSVGGHNIIEPCWYGVPVLFGPYMHAQTEMVSLIKEYQAGWQVSREQFVDATIRCLLDKDKCKSLGEGGLRLVQSMKGATERTFHHLEPYLRAIVQKY